LRAEKFEALHQQLGTQKLKAFLELFGKIYLVLVKVFYANLKFNGGVLKSSLKGVKMEITKPIWKDVVDLRQRGVQVRKGEITTIEEFNKVQYFNQCV